MVTQHRLLQIISKKAGIQIGGQSGVPAFVIRRVAQGESNPQSALPPRLATLSFRTAHRSHFIYALSRVQATTSGGVYEIVHHPFQACLLELNVQLVAFHCGDRPVAEFIMEDPLAELKVVAWLGGEA